MERLRKRMQEYYKEIPLVFGCGKTNARLMLIGEAPGKEEVVLGRPFVGKAGKNLDEFLQTIGINRKEIYISNVCCFRPYKVSEKGSVSNRTPTRKEIKEALSFLYEEINIVRPKIIVTLGNTPLRACFDDFTKNIGDIHGEKLEVPIENIKYDIFALYHPASIIYNRKLKDVYLQDLEKLRGLL